MATRISIAPSSNRRRSASDRGGGLLRRIVPPAASRRVWITAARFATSRLFLALLTGLALLPSAVFADGDTAHADPPQQVRGFLADHCLDCHEGEYAEGGLDLAALPMQDLSENFARWVRVFDRVHAGEMPPAEMGPVDPDQKQGFLDSTAGWLRQTQHREFAMRGRVRGRRLTNRQLERTLHDLLGIDVPLASRMPDEPRTDGFATVADGQPMSHFQLANHLTVVDAALDEAYRRALGPADEWERLLDAKTLSRRRPKSRTREPELIDGRAVTWSSRLIFYGRLPATTARDGGWYRFVVRASALKRPADHGVWCTVRSGRCVSSAPLLSWIGAFEATDQPQQWTFEAWLPEGHMLEIRPGDMTLKMARFQGGQVGPGEGGPQNVPGVAIESIRMERFHCGADDLQIRKFLFGDLEVRPEEDSQPARVVAEQPRRDAERLIQRFARRAFRRPVSEELLEPYIGLVHAALESGEGFSAALRGGYRAILCSPRFLYFFERPGELDQYAIASRLSYLVWNSMPDERLFQLAEQERLRDPDVLHAEVERMLAARGEDLLVRDLAAEWLDLRLIDFTEPDRRLYPDFDIIVQQSMLAETHAFLETLLREDRSVRHLIDSDFTYLNSRLARYYGIPDVKGDPLRRWVLDPATHRGGLLTQGAILKVTANGTTTSPVIRGVWVSERLLGEEIPPPPANVPAIEPDIRGAKSIREMLAKHRSEASCAACHAKIDPPGFALENFDAAGRWRDTYPRLDGSRRRPGLPIDAGYELPDGRLFEDLEEFQRLIVAQPERLARNLAEHLMVYATGAPIAFADRDGIRSVVETAASSDYGVRSLLHAVVTSPIFLKK